MQTYAPYLPSESEPILLEIPVYGLTRMVEDTADLEGVAVNAEAIARDLVMGMLDEVHRAVLDAADEGESER